MARPERAGPTDEKVTINVGPMDLGRIDLLVEEGFYASRTDLIRAAIRRVLDEHKLFLDDVVTRREFSVGYHRLSAASLEAARKRRERLQLRVVGVLELTSDVTPEIADKTIGGISVLGSFRAPPDVIAVLGDRIAKRGSSDG